jgi:hypothetical protein
MTSSRAFRVARTALMLAGMAVFLTGCHHFWRHHHHHHHHHRGDLPLTLQAETPANPR